MKNKKILLLESMYSLFLYLLLNSKENILILVEENFYKNNKKIINKFKDIEIISLPKKKKYNNKLLKFFSTIVFRWKIKMKISKIKYRYRENIMYGLDHTLIGNNLINKNYILFEDGIKNYNLKEKTWDEKIKSFLLGYKLDMGRDKKINKIYLTGLASIPKEIEFKVELIDLKGLWNKKNKVEQEKILNVFDFSLEIIENLKKRKNIILTQPLSEDGILLESEKIEIYKKIIENYDRNTLIIKKHPRETTKYKEIFEGIEVLEQPFPSELLNLLNIKFEKAITIFSTAACTIGEDVEIDFYGTEIHPKILKSFGSQEHIVKRNKFLEEKNE